MPAGRPAQKIDNSVVSLYLMQFDRSYPVPDWVDNVIRGAAQVNDGRPSHPPALLNALQQLQVLSYDTAYEYVNRKMLAMGEKPYGRRYAFLFFSRLRFAHNGLKFHYEKRFNQPLN